MNTPLYKSLYLSRPQTHFVQWNAKINIFGISFQKQEDADDF